MRIQMMSWLIAGTLAACGGSKPPAPSPEPPGGEPAAAPKGKALTQEECEAQSGQVVGDIGDGAVHRPDYVCPSGKPPLGSIAPREGGPIAVEGSVCCPQ